MKTNVAINQPDAEHDPEPDETTFEFGEDYEERLGLLTDAALVYEGDAKECPDRLAEVLEDLRRDLRPKGSVENMLVETIATCVWRKRRALIAESGMVGRQQAGMMLNYFRKILRGPVATAPPGVRLTADDFEQVSAWIDEPVRLLDNLELEVDVYGHLRKDTVDFVQRFWWESAPGHDSLGWYLNLLNDAATNKDPEKYFPFTPDEAVQMMRDAFQSERERLARLKDLLREEERVARDAQTAAVAIPNHEEIRSLAAYEASLDRQMYSALAQLERLQRARLGEAVYAMARFASTASPSQLKALSKISCTRLRLQGSGGVTALLETMKMEVKGCTR